MTTHHLHPRYKPEHRPNILIELETTPTNASVDWNTTPAGGDPWALRGIPTIGHGIPGGAIPGTTPHHQDLDTPRRRL